MYEHIDMCVHAYNIYIYIYIFTCMEVNNGKESDSMLKNWKQSNPMWWIYSERKSML